MVHEGEIQKIIEQRGLNALVQALEQGLDETLWGIVLFGSAARGEARESSDLDILVVADALPEKFMRRMQFLRSLVP